MLCFYARRWASRSRRGAATAQLKKMLEVRELLKDLKARVITNRKFRLALEKIVKDQDQVESIMQELDRIAPLPEVISGKPAGEE